MSKLTDALKRLSFGDALIRRNPIYYRRARAHIEALQAQGLAARKQWVEERLKKVLQAARRSAYGRKVGGGAALSSWPLLEKNSLRAESDAFRAPGTRITVRGATGGTTGLPLRLVRSLPAVVFEQASLDWLLEKLGVQPGRMRMAVLRADSIKDPADRSPPYWILTHGGRRMVLSPHHLSADTVTDYARALREFRPDVLWVYPTALESLCRLLLRAGQRLYVPRVHASSEVLGPGAWRLAQAGARRAGDRRLLRPGRARCVRRRLRARRVPLSAGLCATSSWCRSLAQGDSSALRDRRHLALEPGDAAGALSHR